MTDEMTVQTKSSVTPMVVGGVLGAGAGAGATFIPKIKEYISESPKYKEFDDIVREACGKDSFERIMDQAGLDDAKKLEINNEIITSRLKVDNAEFMVKYAKDALKDEVEGKGFPSFLKDEVTEQSLTEAEKRQLKLKKFIEQNIDKDDNLSNDVKKFIKKLRNAGSEEKKINDVKNEFTELYEKYESISLESLDETSKKYIERLRTANKLKKEGSKIEAFKSAKAKLKEAEKAREDYIKKALEPYKEDFKKLYEGKKSWGKVTAIIAGGLVVGSIIGSFFRSKNNDIA